MKFQFKYLLLWFALYYFFILGGINTLIYRGVMSPISFTETNFDITSFVSLFLWWLLSYSVFYYFYPTRRWILLTLGLVVSFGLPIVIRYLVEQKLMFHFFGVSNYPQSVDLSYYFKDNYSMATEILPIGVIYYFIRQSINKTKKEQQLIIENQKMQLSLLQSQINPHFLLNALNNVQALVYTKSDKAIPALEHLSEFLKYNLYESKSYISVQEEISVIKKYIELEKLRYDYELNILLDIDPEVLDDQIPQHLLIPLVENTFKHADLKSTTQPSLTRIQRKSNAIHVKSTNTIAAKSKDKTGGIGLDNLSKRLKLLYNGNHTMEINKAGGIFSVEIQLPIR